MSLKYAAVGEDHDHDQDQDQDQDQEGSGLVGGNSEHGPDNALNESFELSIQSQKFPEAPSGARQRTRESDFKPMQVSSSTGEISRDLWKRRCYALFAIGAMIIVIIVIVAIDNAEERVVPEKSDVPTPRTKWSVHSSEQMKSWHMLHTKYMIEVKKNFDYDLVLLGDSITESWTGTSYGNKLDRAVGGPRAFEVAFPSSQFPSKAAFGISGDQTQHLLFRLQHGELPAQDSSAVWKNVVVLIGVNNLRAGMTAEETYNGIVAGVKELERSKSVKNLFVSLVLPSTEVLASSIQTINDKLMKTTFSKASTKLIPCAWDVLANGNVANKTLLPDMLHPNEAGLVKYGACISRIMKGTQR